MKIQRHLFPFIFAVLLLFAQQGGYVHALSHVNEAEQFSDKTFPNSKICGKCLSFAHLDSFTHAAKLTLDIASTPGVINRVPIVLSHYSSFFFYHSRAPPVVS